MIDRVATFILLPTIWIGPPLLWLCLFQFKQLKPAVRVFLASITSALLVALFVYLGVSNDDRDVDLLGGVQSAVKFGVMINSFLTLIWGGVCGMALELFAKWKYK